MDDLEGVGTHCPASKTADIIGDRWVLLIVRAMVLGATRYSDFQRAIPRISPTVLSNRLKQLDERGVVVRKGGGAKSTEYRLTPSGRELEPLVAFMALWGLRWAKRNIWDEKFDVGGMMWDFHRTLRTEELPDGETVISISLSDVQQYDKWWIIADGENIDLCTDNPGKDVDLYLSGSLPALLRIWLGETPLRDAIDQDEVVLNGDMRLVRSAPQWFPQSPVAGMRGQNPLDGAA